MNRPTCCAFGGSNMNVLFITSALEKKADRSNVSGQTISINTDKVGNYSNRFVGN